MESAHGKHGKAGAVMGEEPRIALITRIGWRVEGKTEHGKHR